VSNVGIEVVQMILGQLSNGLNAGLVGKNVGELAEGQGDRTSTAISIGQAIDGLMGSIGKALPKIAITTAQGDIPLAGILLSVGSLSNNLYGLSQQLSSGELKKGSLDGAIGDACSLTGGVILGLTAIATAEPAAVGIAAALGGHTARRKRWAQHYCRASRGRSSTGPAGCR
jgi:hypothetical protein